MHLLSFWSGGKSTQFLNINPFTSGVVLPNDFYFKHTHTILYHLCCLVHVIRVSRLHGATASIGWNLRRADPFVQSANSGFQN